MRGRLTAIKNIAWALAIVLCLLAVFIGLLFAAFTRNSEEQFRGGVKLGTRPVKMESVDSAAARPAQMSDGSLQTLAQTEDAGQAYIDSLTFLCDSPWIGLKSYGMLSGGESTAQVWTSPSGVMAVADMADSRIVFPNDGSIITASNAAMIVQPPILVIALGNDGITSIDQFDFMDRYKALINSIRRESPNTWILCMPLTSVTIDYNTADGLSAAKCSEANGWIKTVCEETGAYYVDAVSTVQDVSGLLLQEYASADGRTLNSTGLNQILQYLRYHAVQ